MNRVLSPGIALLVVGLAGYVLGIVVPYPGRAMTITGIMAGVTLSVIGLWGAPEDEP